LLDRGIDEEMARERETDQSPLGKTAQAEREKLQQTVVDLMEHINNEFDCDLRNAVLKLAEDQEALARDLRALLVREAVEKRVLGKVIEALQPKNEVEAAKEDENLLPVEDLQQVFWGRHKE
jgi:hypothetical protein